jgi:DnaK suppressor protein
MVVGMARKPRDQQRTDAQRTPATGSGKLDATGHAASSPPRKRAARERTASPGQIQERLLSDRAAAIAELTRLGAALEREESVGPGDSPFEEGDVAQASEQRDMAFMQRERLAQRINRLTRALEHLAAGTYGVCEECGANIDPARLAAMPEVTRCRDCQERSESERAA